MPLKVEPIGSGKLRNIAEAADYAVRTMGVQCVKLQRDHGHLLGYFGDGKGQRLLIDRECTGDAILLGKLASVLQHADPATMKELARGYGLAMKAGLL